MTFYSPDISEQSPFGDSESAVGADVGVDEGAVIDEQLAQYALKRITYNLDGETPISETGDTVPVVPNVASMRIRALLQDSIHLSKGVCIVY